MVRLKQKGQEAVIEETMKTMDKENLLLSANRAMRELRKVRETKASAEDWAGDHTMPDGMRVRVDVRVTQTRKRGGHSGGASERQ